MSNLAKITDEIKAEDEPNDLNGSPIAENETTTEKER
jgi:hypothetical protein